MPVAQGGVREAVAAVRERIAAAAGRAGRDPAAVRLIAVTKSVDTARIAQAVEAGVADLGENRVQEAVAKVEQLPAGLRWHLLGHLQHNKAGRAAGLFDVVHSVDSVRIGEALAARRPADRGDLSVLLEVELTGLPGHTGFTEVALAGGLAALRQVPGLRVEGLMTMAPPADDPADARPTFARLRRLRDALEQQTGQPLPELSMGMTGDFDVAVEEGSTMVRVGRAIFGERPPRERRG
jgi:PLP dependent protein